MFSSYSRLKALTMALGILTVFGPVSLASARTAYADGSATQRTQSPTSLIQASNLEDAAKSAVIQLIGTAKASSADREQFIAATESIVRILLDAGQSLGFVEEFASSYNSALSVETKFEWEINPSVGKCNAQFECSWAIGVCVVITWHDGNGSGGINCISQSR